MCGIHGVMTGKKVETNADDFVRSGLIAGMLRGKDSSGIGSIDPVAGTVAWQKLPLPGMYLTQDKYGDTLIREARNASVITMCHTRAATVGGINLNNAHPFYVNDDEGNGFTKELIGVHNGTLDFWKTKKGGNNFTVDSEWALNMIFNDGLDAFKEINGAYAFVWWESGTADVLHFARNTQRPMHVAITDNGALLYASEAEMLYWLAMRHNIKLTDKGVMTLEAGYHYAFDLNDVGNPKKEELPKAPATTYSGSYNANTGTSNHVSRGYYDHMVQVDRWLKTMSESKEAQPEAVVRERVPSATREEFANARAMGWMGAKGTFTVVSVDRENRTAYGEYVADEGGLECEASIRNVDGLYAAMQFKTQVIGVIDDERSVHLVCTKPRVTPMIDEGKLVVH